MRSSVSGHADSGKGAAVPGTDWQGLAEGAGGCYPGQTGSRGAAPGTDRALRGDRAIGPADHVPVSVPAKPSPAFSLYNP